ncbi:MAG: phosphatidylglycerophosphatase A family protein [Pyrinomonadaceae bacterium]
MKQEIERRKPQGIKDYIAIAFTTFGVGYLPVAQGTWGSAVGVAIYLGISFIASVILADSRLFIEPVWPFLSAYPTFGIPFEVIAWLYAGILFCVFLFCLAGIWAAGRSVALLGNSDPSEAVVDEVIGQLIVFLFVPFGIGWPLILAGFLLFRLFDIWKPYPIRALEVLPGGLGICADDIVAGVYAGVSLAIIYAVTLSF